MSFPSRRTTLCGVVIVLAAMFAAGRGDAPCRADEEDEKIRKYHAKLDKAWGELFFATKRKVTKVQVVIFEKSETAFESGFNKKKKVSATSSSEDVCKAVHQFLEQPMRYALSSTKGGGGGSWYKVGEVVVTTDQGAFTVGLSYGGFTCDGEAANYQNVFFSWGLAHYVDDVYFEQSGQRLPEEVLKGWSGEAHLNHEKETYANIKKK